MAAHGAGAARRLPHLPATAWLAIGAAAGVPVALLIAQSREPGAPSAAGAPAAAAALAPPAERLPPAAAAIRERAAKATSRLSSLLHRGEAGDEAALRAEQALYVPAARLAAAHPAEAAEVRARAEAAAGGAPLPPRFTDAELMRFAVHNGYLRARSPAAREAALRKGAAAAAETARWLAAHAFATDAELARFARFVRWGAPDAAGRPTLHVALAPAMREARGAESLALANAVVTHMERAVTGALGDAGGRPEQVNVVIDAAGASAASAARAAWVLKALAASLNRHYPARLHELQLVDLPPVLAWLVAAIRAVVHAATARKVRAVRTGRAGGGGAHAAPPELDGAPPAPA
jgi:hypothetical protein